MSYVQLYYHIIFSTKNREQVLNSLIREEVYRYIWGIIQNKGCHLYRINGTEDHIHIFTSIAPSIAVADFVRDIKSATTIWIKKENVVTKFPGWQSEYSAFSKSFSDKELTIEYIKNQEEHHRLKSWKEELQELYDESGVEFDDKYLK